MSDKKPLIVFVLIFVAILALNSDFMGGRKIKTFSVTADTNVSQVKGLSKYVSQEEVDGFAFRYWDIDKDRVQNNDKMEALRLLLKSKNTQEILAYMKDNNISVDEPLHYGVTALMYASFYDDMDTAKELLNLGANPHLYDKYNLCALSYAIQNEKAEMVKFLLENGVKFEEAKVVQGYLVKDWNLVYDLDTNNIEKNYTGEIWTAKHGFVAYYPFHNTSIDIMKIALESGFKPYAYATSNVDYPKVEAGNSLEEILTKSELDLSIDNEKKSPGWYNPGEYSLELALDKIKFGFSIYSTIEDQIPIDEILNLLLDNNISGQPSKRYMKKIYDDWCYDDYKRAIREKVYYLAEMRQGVDKYAEELTTYQYAKKHNMKRKADRSGLDILMQLLKDKIIVRTPKEPTPFIVNLLDKNIERHAKYCGDKDLDFERDLVNWNDEIFAMAQQYHALFKWEDKPIPETANFKDTREFMMYLNDREKNKFLPNAIVKDTNMTYEKYIQKEVDKQAQTLTEKIKFGNKSKQELIELEDWFYN